MALREALGETKAILCRSRAPMSATASSSRGLERQGREYGIAGVRNVVPERWLVEGDQVDVGGHVFTVLHCPGHTPGHVVFPQQGRSVRAGRGCDFPRLGWANRLPLWRWSRPHPARSAISCSHSATRSRSCAGMAPGSTIALERAHQSLYRQADSHRSRGPRRAVAEVDGVAVARCLPGCIGKDTSAGGGWRRNGRWSGF